MTRFQWMLLLWVVSAVAGYLVFFTYATNPRVNKLQTAGSVAKAQEVMTQWRNAPGQLAKARKNMTVDYVFVVTFYPWLALVCLLLAARVGWTPAGKLFAALAVLAGVCDLIEDLALEVVWRNATELSTKIAMICSYSKLGLSTLAGLFVLTGLVALLFRQNRM